MSKKTAAINWESQNKFRTLYDLLKPIKRPTFVHCKTAKKPTLFRIFSPELKQMQDLKKLGSTNNHEFVVMLQDIKRKKDTQMHVNKKKVQ